MKKSDLYKWIENYNDTKNNNTQLVGTIKAFSEYICAVDQEYQYNKTFLNGFIESFYNSVLRLKTKKKCLIKIIKKLKKYKEVIYIDIDGAWIYNGKTNVEDDGEDNIILSDSFDKWDAASNKIKYQIRKLDEPEFVIAGIIDVSKQDDGIKEVVNLFNSRIKMRNEKK